MLSSAARMRHVRDFAAAVRQGARAGRPTLVVYLLARPVDEGPPLVGLVVSRAVGVAVVRNRVKRRLRHAARERLHRLPRGSLLVIRANPTAATARHEQLAADLDVALERVLRRTGHQPHNHDRTTEPS